MNRVLSIVALSRPPFSFRLPGPTDSTLKQSEQIQYVHGCFADEAVREGKTRIGHPEADFHVRQSRTRYTAVITVAG